MKTLFAYYSLEGNCRQLSRAMAEAVGGDLAELKATRDTMPRGAILKYLVGGKRSLLKETVELAPLGVNPDDYGLVVVGGPVWFQTMAPEVRSFLAGNDWTGKKLGLFAMHRGGPGVALSAMAKIVKERGGEVVDQANFVDLRRPHADETKMRAVEWAVEMCQRVGAEVPLGEVSSSEEAE